MALGDSWETNFHKMPHNVLLEAYEYYDEEARMMLGYAAEIRRKMSYPVWRLHNPARGLNWTMDAMPPEGVLLAFRKRVQSDEDPIPLGVGYASDYKNLRPRTTVEWMLTGIAKEQLGV